MSAAKPSQSRSSRSARFVLGPAADAIVILDAQEHLRADGSRHAPDVDGVHDVAEVQVPCGRRGKARDDRPAEAGRHSGQVGTRHAGTCGFRLQPEVSNMLIEPTPRDSTARPADFYIDPWAPVDRAVITHAHGDHLRPGAARTCATAASRLARPAPPRGRRAAPRRRIRRGGRHQRRARVAAPGRAYPRLGAGARRASRRGLGGVRRLQARARSDVRAVRAAALPHVHHRGDLRAAACSAGIRRRRPCSRSAGGGTRCARAGGRRCSSATRSARRSACWPSSRACTDRPVYVHGALDRADRRLPRRGRAPASRRSVRRRKHAASRSPAS